MCDGTPCPCNLYPKKWNVIVQTSFEATPYTLHFGSFKDAQSHAEWRKEKNPNWTVMVVPHDEPRYKDPFFRGLMIGLAVAFILSFIAVTFVLTVLV